MSNLDGIHAEPHIVFLFVERGKLLDVADVFQAGFVMLLNEIIDRIRRSFGREQVLDSCWVGSGLPTARRNSPQRFVSRLGIFLFPILS
jgi:hypothetical protein